MAKTDKSQDTALTKAIEATDLGRGHSFANLFEDFLDFMLSFRCGNPSDRQKKLFDDAKSHPDLWNAYRAAMAAYEEASEDYHDPLGDTFMARISHGDHGQFFTPDELCSLMSRIVMKKDSGSLYDPACGSGRTLLAGLKHAREVGTEPAICAGDISHTCARMTLANLLQQTAHGEVMQGDSLLMDLENFVFYRIETVVNLEHHIVISHYWQYTKATAKKVEDYRRLWYLSMACKGWFYCNLSAKDPKEEPVQNPVDSPLITTPFQSQQLSLF